MAEGGEPGHCAAVILPVMLGSALGALGAKLTGRRDLWLLGGFGGATVSFAYVTSRAAQQRYERGEGLQPR